VGSLAKATVQPTKNSYAGLGGRRPGRIHQSRGKSGPEEDTILCDLGKNFKAKLPNVVYGGMRGERECPGNGKRTIDGKRNGKEGRDSGKVDEAQTIAKNVHSKKVVRGALREGGGRCGGPGKRKKGMDPKNWIGIREGSKRNYSPCSDNQEAGRRLIRKGDGR